MSDPNELPPGSRSLAAEDFDEYLIEVFERPDRIVHFVVLPKADLAQSGPRFAALLDRANELAVRATGKPCQRWTIRPVPDKSKAKSRTGRA